jgi:hypothetical protein
VTPTQDRALTAGLCIVAMALAVGATWQGPGLTDDSINYLSTGINVAGSRGWVMLADQPLTIFPPGLPAIMAFGEAIGIGAETTIRIVSVVSFGAIVVLGRRLLDRVVAHHGVVVGATVLLAVSPVLLGVAKMAWSEPPFIALSLVFLLVLGRVLERGSLTLRDVVVLSLVGSGAFLLRYIGVALVVLAGIALLCVVRPLDRRALGRIALFGALSAIVPVACILRNHAVDGTLLGKRIPSPDSLGDSVYRVAVTLGEWLDPLSDPAPRVLAALGVVTALLVVVALVVALRAGRGGAPDAVGAVDQGQRRQLLSCAGYVLIYLAYLVAASLGTAFEPINSRYLSPVLVPVVVIASAGLAAVLARTEPAGWRRAIAAVPVLLIGLQLVASVDEAHRGAVDGIGYTTSGWADSDLASQAQRLVEQTDGAVIYSNQPFGLWAATRLQPVRWGPFRVGFRGAPVSGELEAVAAQVACAPESTFLVRYRYGSPRVLSNEAIRAAVDVQRVAVAEDGAIFQLTPKEPAPCTADPPARPTLHR